MSRYTEEEYLLISGIQHFAFCKRQWALIHVENQWAENWRTADGGIMHERAHDAGFCEKRAGLLSIRGMRVASPIYGITGECDVVEFRADDSGVKLDGREGKWLPYPVEYKRGAPKSGDEDRLQLCCQALCLEEMLGADIAEGALFYGETRRRERVSLDDELRRLVKSMLEEMHAMYARGYTPRVKTGSRCKSCSLNEACLPRLNKAVSVGKYISDALKAEGT